MIILDAATFAAAAVGAAGGLLGGVLSVLSIYSHRRGLDPYGTWGGPDEPPE